MKRLRMLVATLGVVIATTAFVGWPYLDVVPYEAPVPVNLAETPSVVHSSVITPTGDDPKPLPEFVQNGLAWLAEAQFDNGGWGAGSHANQGVRDPHAVRIDPATTAFSAMAFLRAGNTLTDGAYRANVSKALA